jgi:hypothetical protein
MDCYEDGNGILGSVKSLNFLIRWGAVKGKVVLCLAN